jgi:aspartyl protease family protein
MRSAGLLVIALLLAEPVWAQRVTFNGSMGDRALLLIDGQPRVLAVGATAQGVRLITLDGAQAQIEVDGQRRLLRLSAGQTAGGAAADAPGGEIVLTAGIGGHFTSGGSINGRQVRFLVDTGASVVTLSQAEADRIGLDYRSGQRGFATTANGRVPTHLVTLTSLRIGDVEAVNVPAAVLPASMDHVLLGNSFLSRFQLTRENDVMRLGKRP